MPRRVLGYLGYDKPVISFGQNLFNTPDEETWGATFQNGLYSYYQGGVGLPFAGFHPVEESFKGETHQILDFYKGVV